MSDALPDGLDEAEQAGRSRRFLHFSSAHNRPDPLTYSSELSDRSEQQQAARREPRVVDMSQNADANEQNGKVEGSSPGIAAEDQGERDVAEDFQNEYEEEEGGQDEEAEPYWMADDYGEDPSLDYDPGDVAVAEAEIDPAIKRFRRGDGWTVLNASLEASAQPVQQREARQNAPGLRSVEDVILRKADMRKVKDSEAAALRQPGEGLLQAASSAMAGPSATGAADSSEAAPQRQEEARSKGVLSFYLAYMSSKRYPDEHVRPTCHLQHTLASNTG